MPEPERLRGTLSKLAAALGIDEPEAFAFLFNEWGQIVGPEIAARCQPVSLKKGTLKLRTDSPGWAGQLRYLSRQVLGAVNSRFKTPIAKRIEVSIVANSGEVPKGKSLTKTNDRLSTPSRPSSEELESASKLVAKIEDEALARAAKNAYLAGKMHGRRRR